MTDNTQYKAKRDEILKDLAISMYSNGYNDRVAGSSVGVTPNNLGHAEPIMNLKVEEATLALDELFLEVMSSMELPMGVDSICMRLTEDSIRKVITGKDV